MWRHCAYPSSSRWSGNAQYTADQTGAFRHDTHRIEEQVHGQSRHQESERKLADSTFLDDIISLFDELKTSVGVAVQWLAPMGLFPQWSAA